MTVTFLFTVKFYNRSANLGANLPFRRCILRLRNLLSAVRYWLGRGAQ